MKRQMEHEEKKRIKEEKRKAKEAKKKLKEDPFNIELLELAGDTDKAKMLRLRNARYFYNIFFFFSISFFFFSFFFFFFFFTSHLLVFFFSLYVSVLVYITCFKLSFNQCINKYMCTCTHLYTHIYIQERCRRLGI
jgi:hypothetical protein